MVGWQVIGDKLVSSMQTVGKQGIVVTTKVITNVFLLQFFVNRFSLGSNCSRQPLRTSCALVTKCFKGLLTGL